MEWKVAGQWYALSYTWNVRRDAGGGAPAGSVRDISFIDENGATETAHYLVPNQAQCGQCHQQNDLRDAGHPRPVPEQDLRLLLGHGEPAHPSDRARLAHRRPGRSGERSAAPGGVRSRPRARWRSGPGPTSMPTAASATTRTGSARTTGLVLLGQRDRPPPLRRLQAPGRRGRRFGRAAVRRRAGRPRPLDHPLPDELQRCRPSPCPRSAGAWSTTPGCSWCATGSPG